MKGVDERRVVGRGEFARVSSLVAWCILLPYASLLPLLITDICIM
jgi:hypothetical protein